MKWFNCTVEDTVERLQTNLTSGLTESAASDGFEKHGPNMLLEQKGLSPLLLFLAQSKNPMLIILLVGAVLSGIGGHMIDSIAILVLVLANATITFGRINRSCCSR